MVDDINTAIMACGTIDEFGKLADTVKYRFSQDFYVEACEYDEWCKDNGMEKDSQSMRKFFDEEFVEKYVIRQSGVLHELDVEGYPRDANFYDTSIICNTTTLGDGLRLASLAYSESGEYWLTEDTLYNAADYFQEDLGITDESMQHLYSII